MSHVLQLQQHLHPLPPSLHDSDEMISFSHFMSDLCVFTHEWHCVVRVMCALQIFTAFVAHNAGLQIPWGTELAPLFFICSFLEGSCWRRNIMHPIHPSPNWQKFVCKGSAAFFNNWGRQSSSLAFLGRSFPCRASPASRLILSLLYMQRHCWQQHLRC